MRNILIVIILSLSFTAHAQMWNGQDTLYGNEWIHYDQPYFKINIAEDGIYRISGQVLSNAGIDISQINQNQYQLFKLGAEQPLYISSPTSTLSGDDFIEFYGEKNRGELDKYLFFLPEKEMLNPYYSMFTDTSAYFLTWGNTESGKRYTEAENDLVNLPAPEQWYWRKDTLVFSEEHIEKKYDGENLITLSSFDMSEGYGSNWSTNRTFTLERPMLNTNVNQPGTLSIRYTAKKSGYDSHHTKITLNDVLLLDTLTQQGFNNQNYSFPIEANINSTLNLQLEGLFLQPNTGTNNDNYSVAFIQVQYPAYYKFDGQTNCRIHLADIDQKKYLELQNLGTEDNTNIIYDLNNQLRWTSNNENHITKIVLLPEAMPHSGELWAQEQNTIHQIQELKPITFVDYSQSNANYIILSNRRLMGDNSPIWAYKDYRSSAIGGNYQVLVVEIAQLYYQFAYGIDQHPLSIRNFVHFLKKNNETAVHFFIIGKGYVYQFERDKSGQERAQNLIPTFGSPGSDRLLLSDNLSSIPVFPIGRLAAKNESDIGNYLTKVKEHEAWFSKPRTFENYAWHKHLMHLRGGHTYEETQFTNYLSILKTEIENNPFSGVVTDAFSSSNDPVALSVSETAIKSFNNGIAINTLLGHGAIVNTDVGLDDPLIFDNAPKYPLMFALGCLTGNIHTQENSISERFVLANQRGAIGYIASSGFAYPNKLINYTKEFYRLLGRERYGNTIGTIDRLSISKYDLSQDFPTKSLMQQLTFQGDPALKINGTPQQDYVIDPSSVRTAPHIIDINQDSFLLSFIIGNIGMAHRDTFALKISLSAPNGTINTYIDTITVSQSFTDYEKYISLPKNNTEGISKIKIDLDIYDQIEEIAEDNNHLIFPNGRDFYSFIITDKKIKIQSPRNFSIVNNQNMELFASSATPFEFDKYFIFQLDTTAYFDSPFLKEAKVQNSEGIFSWQPDVNFQNNTVYYWRVTQDSIPGSNEGYLWSNASFLFDENIEAGWNQSHFFQFTQDNFNQVVLEEPQRKFELGVKENTLLARAVGAPPVGNDRSRFFLNNSGIYKVPGTDGANLSIIVIDALSGKPWENPPGGEYGALSPGSEAKPAYSFRVKTPEEREKIVNFLQNVIPDGNYIGIVTYHAINNTYLPEEWAADSLIYGSNLFQILEQQGAKKVRQLAQTGSRPYSICYKKGTSTNVIETLAGEEEDRAHSLLTYTNKWDNGQIESPLIGPANYWENVHWQYQIDPGYEPPYSYQLDLYGIKEGSQKELLIADLTEDTNIENIDASTYPFLQLKLTNRDTTSRQFPELLKWQIKYQPTIDLALSPQAFHADTLLAGDQLSLRLNIFNFSKQAVDSTKTTIDLVNLTNNQHQVKQFKVLNIPSNGRLVKTLTVNTKEFSGNYQLLAEINPPERLFTESTYNNNLLQHSLFIKDDRKNPFIDITFDGKRIFDNDIVSPTPEIVISLTDESPYFAITDTTAFSLKLKHQYTTKNLFFTNPDITFIPAVAPGEKAIIEYRPHFEEEGTYSLLINGKDASGNLAANISKEVNFQIILEQAISNVLPYPNPFTTQTRFAYTLTGTKPPEQFTLRIMTISGRIVREVSKAEFGALKIGTHLSDFVWDGTDQFGDKLANGTYLYQILTKDEEGNAYKRRETNQIDSFFRNGIGKIVILR